MLQIITTYDEMQSVFNQMFAEAVKTIPAKEATLTPYIIDGNELAEKTGVTIQTIIRWRKKGKIPFMQIGSAIRYDLYAVVEALSVGAKKKGGKQW